MKIVNLTPHAIVIQGLNETLTVAPSGQLARLSVTREVRPSIIVGDVIVPVTRPSLGVIIGLPDPVEGTVLIVSAFVAEAAKRADVMSPGELVRDSAGVIVGARGLCSYV